MYQAIRKHPTARQIYGEHLEQDSVLDDGEAAQMIEDYRRGLDEGRPQARAFVGTTGNRFTVDWSRHLNADWHEPVQTGVLPERLASLASALTQVPADFTLHPRVARLVEDRRRMYAGELPLDWGAAETMAYAALLVDGYDVRLTGQDTRRGTFFHRHAVWYDQATGRTHEPLAQIAADHARFRVIDSTLSEEAVLGFEYGFSTTDPETLVIWEGQFGDFVNGAQVIVDQFITSGEAKWGRLSGITLFLPHGYEGQGPEHSTARLERFLQLSAEMNCQICVPSTPAQMFHLLRRQMLRALRKPLVVMTPKSLLRHKHSSSTMSDLETGWFHNPLDVGMGNGIADLQKQPKPLVHAQPPGLREPVDRLTLDVFHREVGQPVVRRPAIQQPGDVGVIERRQNLSLGPEPLQHLVGVHAPLDELDGHPLRKRPVNPLGEIHRPHAAAAERAEQPIGADPPARRGLRVVRQREARAGEGGLADEATGPIAGGEQPGHLG
jgi:hypothetical protein